MTGRTPAAERLLVGDRGRLPDTSAASQSGGGLRAGDDAMYEQHRHHSTVLRRAVTGCPFCQPPADQACRMAATERSPAEVAGANSEGVDR